MDLSSRIRCSSTLAARADDTDTTQSTNSPVLSHGYLIITVLLILIAIAVLGGVAWSRSRNQVVANYVYAREPEEPKMWEAHMGSGSDAKLAEPSSAWGEIMVRPTLRMTLWSGRNISCWGWE